MYYGSQATTGHPIELQPFLSLDLYLIHNVTEKFFLHMGDLIDWDNKPLPALQNVDSMKWNGEPHLYKRISSELKNMSNKVKQSSPFLRSIGFPELES